MKTTKTRGEVSLLLLAALSMMASPISWNVGAAESVSTPPPASEATTASSSGSGSTLRRSSNGLAQNVQAGTPGYSAISEVVKLSQSGVEDPVIQSFVASSISVYPPSADDIIYLHQNGISAPVITALIQRGNTLRAQAIQAARQTQSQSPPPEAPAPAVAPAPLAPSYSYPVPVSYPVATYSYSSYPLVSYPAYSYAYDYPYSYWRYGYRYPYNSFLSLSYSSGRFHRGFDRFNRFGGHFGNNYRPFVSRGASFSRPIAYRNAGPWTPIPGHRFAGPSSFGRRRG